MWPWIVAAGVGAFLFSRKDAKAKGLTEVPASWAKKPPKALADAREKDWKARVKALRARGMDSVSAQQAAAQHRPANWVPPGWLSMTPERQASWTPPKYTLGSKPPQPAP
jgi:hypothetical protein